MTENSKKSSFTHEQRKRLEDIKKLREGTEEDVSTILAQITGKVTKANYSSRGFYQQPDIHNMIIGQPQPSIKVGHGLTLVAKVENSSGILEGSEKLTSIYLNIPAPPPINIGDRIRATIIAADILKESEVDYFKRSSRKLLYAPRELKDHETPVYIVCMDRKEKTLWTYGQIPEGKVTIRTDIGSY